MMRFVAPLALAALALAGCDAQPEGKPVARAKIDGSVGAPAPMPSEGATIASQVESACRSVIFENTSLTHCLAIPSRHRITTALANGSGENYRSLSMLCFVTLFYFTVIVVRLGAPGHSPMDWISVVLISVLFCAAMMFSRWKQYDLAQGRNSEDPPS